MDEMRIIIATTTQIQKIEFLTTGLENNTSELSSSLSK
jgi:hypothetical protein